MLGKWKAIVAGSLLAAFAAVVTLKAVDTPTPETLRQNYMKAYTAGNYKDAYDGLRKLALDPKDDPAQGRRGP